MTSAFIRLGARGLVVVSLIGLVAVAAVASGSEPSLTMGTFTTKDGIDLKIDSKSWYNGASVSSATWALKNLTPGADKFFNFDDIKPGDSGCTVISMHVKKGEAWLCLDFKNLMSKENGMNEPEASAGDPNGNAAGELATNLQMFGWIDNGDNKYKTGEKVIFGNSDKAASVVLNNKSYAVGDSKNGSSCRKDQTKYVGICWCAGILVMNPATGSYSCDGTQLGNIAQTDSMNVDISIRASSAPDNGKFLCDTSTTQPPPKCEKDRWGKWRDQKGKECKHRPESRNDCRNNGWKQCSDGKGKEFKNQNECTSYVDTHTDRFGRYRPE